MAAVVPYAGSRLPSYVRIFVASCGASRSLVDYWIFLEDASARPAGEWFPPNVRVEVVDDFWERHARASGSSHSIGPRLAAALAAVPRQLVEFKPAIGVVFASYLANYTHWVFADLDMLMGRVDWFTSESELAGFDVVTFGFGDQWRAYTRGQWTMHANRRAVNRAYVACDYLTTRLEARLAAGSHYESCEGCYSFAVRAARLRVKFAVKALTDAAGATDGIWLVDGNVRRCSRSPGSCRPLSPSETARAVADDSAAANVAEVARTTAGLAPSGVRCMTWVNPAYQPCLKVADGSAVKDWGDVTVYLGADGCYKLATGAQSALVDPNSNYISGAFFHFQEWKKSYKSFAAHLPHSYAGRGDVAALGALYAMPDGLVPVPRVRDGDDDNDLDRSLITDVAAAVPLAHARSLEHCSFASCPGLNAFARPDLHLVFPPPVGGKATGGRADHHRWSADDADPEATFGRDREPGTVTLAFAHTGDAVPNLAATGCAWPGPLVAVLALRTRDALVASQEALTNAWRDCRNASRTLVVAHLAVSLNRTAGRHSRGKRHVDSTATDAASQPPPLKALLNVALDAAPTRFVLALRGRARLGAGAYDAILAALRARAGNQDIDRAPRATTLALPEFANGRPASVAFATCGRWPSDASGSDVHSGTATSLGHAPALSSAAYDAWGAGNSTSPHPILADDLRAKLRRLAPSPVLVLDAVDLHGDRRLVRNLDELGALGCYDAAFVRALLLHHTSDIALAPGAFVYYESADSDDNLTTGLEVRTTTHETACGCFAGPKKVQPALQAYANFLAVAIELRAVADTETRLRRHLLEPPHSLGPLAASTPLRVPPPSSHVVSSI